MSINKIDRRQQKTRFTAADKEKVRRNGLQLKKVVEQEEKQILEQEKVWETPAIFRRKQ